jgi:hypothetical protein
MLSTYVCQLMVEETEYLLAPKGAPTIQNSVL